MDALERLTVAAHAASSDYERDAFSYRSYDQDRNGCDIRNDVLRRDLDDITIRAGTNGCTVQTGLLHDPYTGATIDFERGAATSGDVQIDHVVALANAWATGADTWKSEVLQEFGNDPLNLLAVQGAANQQKGAHDAASWLPDMEDFQCEFVARQVAVKLAYELTVTMEERSAMRDVLSTCPDEPLPTAAETATP
ncbi:HNH endonuclease family protein [Pseudactinotalea sp. HY160]|uniref:HNH endonuclease family protein n=1 Tax=Pseudactinotalea sp. HY160 TaxID=2654490 RepID=UPI001D15457A|nr:HNH endonuclease family protein [Pseudactinotalea sp. HY160]